MDDMAEAIEGLGIPVEVMHTESAPGQFEIVTRYGPALKAREHHPAPVESAQVSVMLSDSSEELRDSLDPERSVVCRLNVAAWQQIPGARWLWHGGDSARPGSHPVGSSRYADHKGATAVRGMRHGNAASCSPVLACAATHERRGIGNP